MANRRLEDPRVTIFKSHLVAHRTILAARRELLHAIRNSSYSLVFLVGATGVGKTTLLDKIVRILIEASSPDAPENRGFIPVLKLEAKAPAGSVFSWPTFFAEALVALGDPHINNLPLLAMIEKGERSARSLLRVGSEVEKLRSAYEHAIKNRRPVAVFIDEGHSLTSVTAPKLQATMELLKSLTTLTDTLHVLVGTYAMQPLMWHSGQLARRTKIIHFPPYDADSPDDLNEFASVLEFFEERLPIKTKLKLPQLTETLMTQSGGLVGVLSAWLCEALGRALEEGSKSLLERHLRESAFPVGAIKTIRSEADEGRRFVEKLLDGAWAPKPASKTAAKEASSKGRGKPAAGKRKPVRDPVVGQDSVGR